MSSISSLANEFAALTGRPLATLTISEFVELKKYADSVNICRVEDVSNPGTEKTEENQTDLATDTVNPKEKTEKKVKTSENPTSFSHILSEEQNEHKASIAVFQKSDKVQEDTAAYDTEEEGADEEAILRALCSFNG